MLKIRVPATSANIGSGFDSLGIALELYNYIEMEPWDGIWVECVDAVPKGEDNLVISSAKKVYEVCGMPFTGLHIIQENNIPMTRGLGSSSAALVAGMVGANKILGDPLSKEELICMAAEEEGHPDNSTPAFLGGFVASVLEGGRVRWARAPLSGKLGFAAFVPDFALKTELARQRIPEMVSHKDAVYNLSRAALLSISMLSGDYENLSFALKDRLHQPYRMDLIPGAEKVFRFTQEAGAYGAYISGAGPTIIAITDFKNDAFFTAANTFIKNEFPSWNLRRLHSDETGVVIESQ